MENKKVIAVFGGSFNPPLNSHFSFGKQIINECENIEKVMYLPVNTKYEKPGLLSNEHRYNMLKIICDKNEDFIVSDFELTKQRQLHTYETLSLMQEEYPENELYFVIGTDNLKEISTWALAEELVTNFKILVIERDEDDIEEILAQDEFLIKHKDSFIKVTETIRTNISSTFVRNKLREGKDVRYLMPDEVYYYIKENNLYCE